MATKPRSVTTKPEPTAPTPSDLEAVGGALEEALPGVEILDRALEFDGGTHADLAGVDAGGRMVLVHLAREDEDGSTLEILDLLAFARRQAGLIARHLNSAKVAERLDPRVVVVLEPGDGCLVERLGALRGSGLELLELRSVKSAGGERSYLIPRSEETFEAIGIPANPDRFLEALPPEREELGRQLCERLSRLDDELRTEASSESIAWYFHDRPLVRLEFRGGRLRGVVGARGRPRDLVASRDADELLEEALSRLVEEVGHMPMEDSGRHLPRPGEGEPLLSAEEIEAFRE